MRRVLLCTALFASAACGTEDNPGIETDFVASTIEHLIVPTYDEFAIESATLSVAVSELCNAPDARRLEAAQAQWHIARGVWKQQQTFAFGPYREFPDRYGFNIDFFPPRYDVINDQVEAGDPVSAEQISAMGTTARGLPIVEYLLWNDPVSDPNRCAIAVAVAADLASLAAANSDAWNLEDGYAAELLADGGEFRSTHELFIEIVSRMGFTLEDIRRDRLSTPLGDTADGAPQPEALESRPSGRSLQDLRDIIHGLNRVFEGAETEDSVGLVDMLELRRRPDTINEYRVRYLAVLDALDAIPEPLESSLYRDAELVRALEQAVASLQLYIQVDIGNVLAANLTFNDADGD